MTKDDVLHRIEAAEKGRRLWIDLVERHKIKDQDQVVLFPSSYNQWAYYGALYLDDFLRARNSVRAIILCYDEKIKEWIQERSKKLEIVPFSREDAEKLMALYSLYLFADNLTIISPNEPMGRNGNDLIGVRDVTVEEVVVRLMFKLPEIIEQKPI